MAPERRPSIASSTVAFRRTLSLTSLSFGRLSTSSHQTHPFSPPPLPSSHSQSRARLSTSLGTPSTAPIFDPEAAHYQDPEARKKLRLYLSSSQKFDEAIEFGFPSTSHGVPSASPFQLPPIATDMHSFSRDMQSYFRGAEKGSFFDDSREDDDFDVPGSGEDDSSVTEMESPLTPSSAGMDFRCHVRKASSPDLGSHIDSTPASGPPAYAAKSLPVHGRLDREMTLRMTLTRPDLRASEDALYGWRTVQGTKDDPFALDDLYASSDVLRGGPLTTVRPSGPKGLVSRLFKKVKGRP
jgi:hypothetical protein